MAWNKKISVAVRSNWNVNPHIHTRMHKFQELNLLEDYILYLIHEDLQKFPESSDNNPIKCQEYILRKMGLLVQESEIDNEIAILQDEIFNDSLERVEIYREKRERAYEECGEEFLPQSEAVIEEEIVEEKPAKKPRKSSEKIKLQPKPTQKELSEEQQKTALTFLNR